MMHSISENIEVREVLAPIAAGNSIDSNSDRIDMADYESACFIVPITDSNDTGVATLTIQQNSDDSDTGMTAITGAVATATSAANDDLNDTLLQVEVRNPSERYIQATLTSATANMAYGNTIVLLKPRRFPITTDASVTSSTFVQD